MSDNDQVVLVQEIIAQARRLGLTWTLRYATVLDGGTPKNVTAKFDGDDSTGRGVGGSGFISLIGPVPPGSRVAAIYVPPAGQYIIGRVDAPSYIIDAGVASVTPVANTPTSVAVQFTQRFTKAPIVTVTAGTGAPGSQVMEVSVTGVTATGFNIVIYRTNTTATGVNWMAVQMLT